MPYIARWFVVLGVMALLPAAVLLGGSIGEVLRHPRLGLAEVAQHEAPVLVLGVTAAYLFATAAGLQMSRRWALLLALVEAGLIAAVGAVLLAGNARLLGMFGAPEVLALAVIPLGIAAGLLGVRLFWALWRTAHMAHPVGRADLRAIGTLAGVAVAAALGHVLIAGLSG